MASSLRILVLGTGGREHALAWKLAQSPLCDLLLMMPGNAGMEAFGINLPLDPLDFDSVLKACCAHKVDMVISGPEAPLMAGLADQLTAAGILMVGPTQAAARLEGSKVFAKQICAAAHVPTAPYKHFRDFDSATAYVHHVGDRSCVIKRDDPALGKGVILADNAHGAQSALSDFFGQQKGIYGAQPLPGVLIEERLVGEEMSFFALCNGTQAISLGAAQDYKRLRDGDKGPNTGGMGAYGPLPFMTPVLEQTIMDTFIYPILAVLKAQGMEYKGVLYAGLMKTDQGLVLLEYNVRFGDPEAQVLMVRLASDLVPLLLWAAEDERAPMPALPVWRKEAVLGVVLAAQGYPEVGVPSLSPIRGVEDIKEDSVHIFHGATARDSKGRLYGTGGRILTVVGLGSTLGESQARAYSALERIVWPDGQYRKDIGKCVSFKTF